ncbi:TonB-dependent receptor plug domain-containing protein [Shewanella violacea]|uniref:TonB-dependent receptor n=1 Tax=Shewanella violacea (strain JCM 10179 / CIP 106290 / LMG 19151 / DSS12) TaxID=637905 RepID=D4ZAL0_SHEVD|nr:TonB-dependent receptor [Shewanella violacea]BAJ03055.1 TonB-dependent receptor [Shewanella violacea DSS12]
MANYKKKETYMAHYRIKSIQETFTKSLLALAVTSIAFSTNVIATEVKDEQRKIERIEITGSRIKRTDIEAVTPVISISGDDIRRTGALNITEALNKLPIIVPDLGDTTSNSNGIAGMSTQNLRGLGAERTLVLVNGRRHVPSMPGSTSVDMSTIPMPLIERIEIMTGGASAIYGADAVAGVINVILKKEYQGTTINATYGISGESDGQRHGLDITHGSSLLNDSANIVLNFSYYKSKPVMAVDRSYVDRDIAYLTNPNDPEGDISGIPDRTIQEYVRFFNQEDRNFFINNVVYRQNPDGSISPTPMGSMGIMGDPEAGFFKSYTNSDSGYYFGDYNYQRLSVPSEKFNFNLTYQQELTDTTHLLLDAKYVTGSSEQRWNPHSEYGGNYLPTDYAFYTSEQKAEVERIGSGLEWAGSFPELGQSGATWEHEMYQVVAVLEGEIFSDFNWTLSAQHGQSSSEDTRYGDLNQANWDAGKGAWGTSCDSDCVPLNIFQPLTQEMIDYVSIKPHSGKAELKQSIVSASITGDLFELPAGTVGFATGLDYRKESSSDMPSSVSQSGIGSGYSVTKPISGNYNVTEVFSEVRIPLLSNVFLAQTLSVEGAIRYADYSTAGGNTSWNLGAEWQPISDLKFRTSLAKAARAPNINEVYATENFGGEWLVDPCNAWSVTDNPTRTANCAALGVDPDAIPYWTWTNQNFSGNKELKSEEAKTLTIGAVISPRYIDNLNIIVDYWDIDLTDEINSYDMNTIVNGCVDSKSIDNQFCDFITRDDNGIVTLVEMTQLNLAAHKVRGLDMKLDYSYSFDSYGDLSFTTLWSKMLERTLQSDSDQEPEEFVGGMAYPEWRGNISASYSLKDLSTSLTFRYIGEQSTDISLTEEDRSPLTTGGIWYTDINVNYYISENFFINLAINNLTDQGTPQIPSANRGGASYHIGYTGGLYDTIGRYAVLSTSYNF